MIYHHKDETSPKNVIGFKGPLGFYKNVKEGYITLEKAWDKQKEFNLEINNIVRASKKSDEQKNVMKSIKTLYGSQWKVIKWFDGYSRIVSEAKYKTKHWEVLIILTPKQMLQRWPIALAQVKYQSNSVYSLYRAKEITKKVYKKIII